jgi:hypothetical protein
VCWSANPQRSRWAKVGREWREMKVAVANRRRLMTSELGSGNFYTAAGSSIKLLSLAPNQGILDSTEFFLLSLRENL